VARLLEGEKMAPLCAEFGISRKTGYKIYDRYKDCGIGAFTDRSRRAYRQANRLPAPIEAVIVRLKREYPGWGAPKIREKLRQQTTGPHLPAISTVHAVLDRHGLVQAAAATAARDGGHRTVQADRAERPLVCRLQRRVHAGESPILLSPDDHGLREPLPLDVRGPLDHPGDIRVHRLRADVQGIRAAVRHPDGQRGAVCLRACDLRPQQAVGLVAPPGDSDRAEQTRTPAG